jgi:hypothetical protein
MLNFCKKAQGTMGGLKTAYESGWTAEQWIADTHKINGIA